MKPNRMKEKLHAGEPAFGVSVMIPSGQTVEMSAAAGFDWVLDEGVRYVYTHRPRLLASSRLT
jgi:2-keto-3-deoxy-L-rhamnonate aldolase RhmA